MMFPLLPTALPILRAPAPSALRFAPGQSCGLPFSALPRSITPAPQVYPLLFTHRFRSGPAFSMQAFSALPGFVNMALYFIRLRQGYGGQESSVRPLAGRG